MSDTEKAVDATLDLASENQRLRERVAKLEAHVRKGDHFIGAAERAEKAEAERDAALAEVSQLRATISILCDTIASTPAPTRAEAEAWLRAGEPVRGALAVPAEPDYSGLCAAPSCEGHCGYVHARGCEAVREYLADHGGEPYRAPSHAGEREARDRKVAEAVCAACIAQVDMNANRMINAYVDLDEVLKGVKP